MNDSNDSRARRVSLRVRLATASSSAKRSALAHLPSSFRELVRILGDKDVVLRLVALYGGCTLHIPVTWPMPGKPDSRHAHPLRGLLSPRAMLQLAQNYGGTELYIPRCLASLQHMRNAAMVAWFNESTRRGMSSCAVVQRLARRYCLSDRQVWSILKTEALLPNDEVHALAGTDYPA